MSKSEKKHKTGRMENYGMYKKEPSRGKGHVVQESVRRCISNSDMMNLCGASNKASHTGRCQ